MKSLILTAMLLVASTVHGQEAQPIPDNELTKCLKLEMIGCAVDDMERFPPQPLCCTYPDPQDEEEDIQGE